MAGEKLKGYTSIDKTKNDLNKSIDIELIEKFESLGVKNETAKELIKLQFSKNKDKLLQDFNKLNINQKDKEKLQNIDKIQEILQQYEQELLQKHEAKKNKLQTNIKEKLNNTKNEIEFIIYDNSKLEQLLPKLYSKAKNPKNKFENIIIGSSIGTLYSIEKIGNTIINLGKDTIKLPYDIFQLITGKAKIKYIKKI